MTGQSQAQETSTPFNYLFGFKALEGGKEVTYNGQIGVFIEGYMATWQPKDRLGEDWRLDLSEGNISRKALESYFETNPIVLFNHGRDRQVGHKAVGMTVEYEIDDQGVWVKDFIPKPSEKAVELYDIYQKIKSGLYRGFSIAGVWARNAAKTIVELHDVYEHSIAPVPVQGLTTFTLSKAMAFQDEYGLDVEEALEIAADEKAGAVFSRANKSKIQQAIAVLEDLIGESDEDDAADEPGEPAAAVTAAGAKNRPTNKGKPNPFTGVRGTGTNMSTNTGTGTKSISEEREAPQALNQPSNTQGATKTMSKLATQDKPNVEGGDPNQTQNQTQNQDQDTLTFNGIEAKAIRDMLAERETLKMEAEAKAIAEKALADEQKAATEAADAKRRYDEEVQAKALEIGKQLRLGSRMQFGGDVAGNNGGHSNPNPNNGFSGKSFMINRGSRSNEFSILKFAKYASQGREWQYIEEQKSLDTDYKALNETIGEQGGYLVPVQQSTEIVDLLRTQAVVRQMPGVRTVPMTSDTMTMPRLVGGSTAFWASEGANITTSQPNFGQIKFVARKLAAVIQVTQEMMDDGNPGIEQIVRQDIAASLALAEDNAFLQGSGVGEVPLGILQTVGINSVAFSAGAASAAPEYKALIKAAGIVRANNGKPNGIVFNSRIGDYILGVVDTTGQPIANNAIGGFKWNDIQAAGGRTSNDPNMVQFGSLLGLTEAFTNQLTMSANTSGTGTALLGDWSKVYIGDRQDLKLEMDRSLGFLNGTIYIKVTKRCDIVLTIPQVFTALTAFPGVDVA